MSSEDYNVTNSIRLDTFMNNTIRYHLK